MVYLKALGEMAVPEHVYRRQVMHLEVRSRRYTICVLESPCFGRLSESSFRDI